MAEPTEHELTPADRYRQGAATVLTLARAAALLGAGGALVVSVVAGGGAFGSEAGSTAMVLLAGYALASFGGMAITGRGEEKLSRRR